MDDWQVGDKALCIKSGEWSRKGCIYTVNQIQLPGEKFNGAKNKTRCALLRFTEHGPYTGIDASCSTRFRKIKPDRPEGSKEDWELLYETHRKKVSA